MNREERLSHRKKLYRLKRERLQERLARQRGHMRHRGSRDNHIRYVHLHKMHMLFQLQHNQLPVCMGDQILQYSSHYVYFPKQCIAIL